MPRLWDRSKREKRTPFSDLLADYLETQRWMRPKNLAFDTGLSATTIQRYLNGEVVPHDPRILQQISAGTGIPLAQLYEAAGLWLPAPLPVEAQQPPLPRPSRREKATLPPRVAHRPPATALDEAVQRIRASFDPAMAEVMVQALLERAGRQDPRIYWQTRIAEAPPWDDHDAVSTLQIPAVPAPAPAAETHDTQAESHPAGTYSAIRK